MDRHTQALIDRFDEFDRHWPEGKTLDGADAHQFFDSMKRVLRLLKPGTVAVERERRAERQTRLEARRATAKFRRDVERWIEDLDRANADLGEVADAILIASGYRRHDRGGWHLAHDSIPLTTLWNVLDRSINRAQCRMVQALRELARVRRLIAPIKTRSREIIPRNAFG